MKYWGNQIMNEIIRAKVLEDVLAERERQDGMYGDQTEHSDQYWNVIATEENGEVARAIWEEDDGHMYEEIIQCAAVYFAWAEAIRKRGDR
jgi:NTP pyrophosphatase (non-canonical NTP hydrolase)